MAAMEGKGGEWTERKLKAVGGYISAFNNALKFRPSKDIPYTRIYVDAFAGSGARKLPDLPLYDDDPDVAGFAKGSARIALECKPPFDRLVFIDKSKENVAELEELKSSSGRRNVEIYHGDANSILVDLAGKWDRRRWRGVLFVDPYGCQVQWKTLEAIAKTQSIDIWLLFPVNAVRRMLPKNGNLQPGWAERLDEIFGTKGWFDRFYAHKEISSDLFGYAVEQKERNVNLERIERFYTERLQSIFSGGVAAQSLKLGPHGRDPLYTLFFICSNPSHRARQVSFDIADHLIKKWND